MNGKCVKWEVLMPSLHQYYLLLCFKIWFLIEFYWLIDCVGDQMPQGFVLGRLVLYHWAIFLNLSHVLVLEKLKCVEICWGKS